MEYTPYFDTLRKTRLLRGMTDAELTLLTESLAPRVRRYDKGELLLMAGYETKDVGIILEGEITATKPMPDGTPITMARMGPGGVFADVLAGGRSKSPVNVTAAIPRAVITVPGKAVKLPDQHNVKQLFVAVLYHLLKLRAVVCLGRDSTVNVVLDDGDAVLFRIGSAFPDLAFDGFFALVVRGIASIDHGGHGEHLHFIRH